MPRRRLRFLALALFALTAVGPPALAGGATPAAAAPIDDKRAEAAALEAEINANAEQLSGLNEQINANQEQLDQANATVADAEARIAAARAETKRLLGLVRQRAASVYRGSSTGSAEAQIFDLDVTTLNAQQHYAAAQSARDEQVMDDLADARAELAVRRDEAQTAAKAAAEEKARLDATRAEFEAAQRAREALLAQVQGEIATLVAQATAARQQQETAGIDLSAIPAASGDVGAVVAFAQAQLGKPYCYAGSGPDCFDCSGLTMSAWGAAGVGMSHNSESQYGAFPHVPMNALQPGDIVWKPGHVGIYVGGGAVIHAPHTGDVVRYIGVGYFQGAARPG